jgi:hypothetical protein
MAKRRKEALEAKRQDIRISVRMGVSTHKRLCALGLATNRTISAVVLDALRPALASVRVPWIVGPGEHDLDGQAEGPA